MDYQAIINHYYPDDDELKRLLLVHSRAVADKALSICDRHPELGLNRDFIEAAAMLHDIGIRECDAPGIHCYGTRPYIQHGLAGAEMLRPTSNPSPRDRCIDTNHAPSLGEYHVPSLGDGWDELLARVCQRHTGAGIMRSEVVAQGLPLPLLDDDSEPYMPETLEEKLVCYADKFFSKTRPMEEKTFEQAERSLSKFGEDGLKRFREWEHLFEM